MKLPPKPLTMWQRIIGDVMICPACLRIRWSPLHIVIRLTGFCPGGGS